uniref:tryptophan synthase n=1 Tax=Solanum lycopersicum TaxID=4081 RepID=A0A3Q7J8F2_SOLLC
MELEVVLRDYVGLEIPLHFAQKLTDYYKRINKGIGSDIYLKREDLNHGGAHKINNAIAQAMLAKRINFKNVVVPTGAGQHGVATAAACAKVSLECTILMGSLDMERQPSNVLLMKHLGAKVHPFSTSWPSTLCDIISFKDAMSVGAAIRPHPCPTMVRAFKSIIEKETRKQAKEKWDGMLVLGVALMLWDCFMNLYKMNMLG